MCFARAVITAKANIDNDPQYVTICRGDKQKGTLQKRLAEKLMQDAGLGTLTGPCQLDQYKAIQVILSPTYRIKIFDCREELIFKGMLNVILYFIEHLY